MSNVILQLKDGMKFYVSGDEITHALKKTDLEFTTGEFVAVTGESGSGKSTLLHILAGVLPCDKGAVWLNHATTAQYGEQEWEEYRRSMVSFISQDYGILSGNTVLDNVVSALLLAGLKKKEALQKAKELLCEVDLWGLRHRRAAKLSSGQKQRLSIARAVAKPAPVLLADEPTGNLDKENADKVLRLFQKEAGHRLVIMVTHNYDAAEAYVSRHILIENGEVAADEALPVKQEVTGAAYTEKHSRYRFINTFIAALQIKARPVWAAFMCLLFALTAFMFFTLLGTILSKLDDADTRIFTVETFLNTDERRLLVRKPDGSLFSEEDYTRLLKIRGVEAIEKYAVLSDSTCHYRENVDYVYKIVQIVGADGNPAYTERVELGKSDVFGQSVPLFSGNRDFLTAGRLPQGDNEAVAAGGEELIGTTVRAMYCEAPGQGTRSIVTRSMTIVGVTDYGQGLYISHENAEAMYRKMERGSYQEGILTGHSDELAITLSSYGYTDRVMLKITELGYDVVSPYQMCSVVQDEELAKERLTTLLICSSALAVLVVVELVLASALFETEMVSYQRLKLMGLSFKTARSSVFWQIMVLTMAGQLLCGVALYVSVAKGLEQLVVLMNYLELRHLVLISLAHISCSMLAVPIIAELLRNRAFPHLTRAEEIDLSELDAGMEEAQ